MEGMNLLDITIKYFNVIVFVMCILFGMTSLFASWIAWREIHRKNNIIRSVVAAYNIAEDMETGTETVKRGHAQMLKGGVIMDVVTPEHARIAEDAGAVRGHGAGASARGHPSGRRSGPHERSGT